MREYQQDAEGDDDVHVLVRIIRRKTNGSRDKKTDMKNR